MSRSASLMVAVVLAVSCLNPSPTAAAPAEKHSREKGSGTLDVPLPVGQDAKTLVIPFYSPEGKQTMNFEIGVATRLNDAELKMASATVETFAEDGAREMRVVLPESILNLETKIVTSDGDVTIERSDFRLTGDGMIFDTQKRRGTVTGDVEMLIYNRAQEVPDASK